MPAISKIRFTNVVYEGGNKRYNDELFIFDGHNSAILLENGGGKTVFIQTAIQAVLPHTEMAGRKIKETLSLTGTPAHIAIEWILSDVPRRYAVTAVTLFMSNNELDSYRYVYEYIEGDAHSIENIPFAKEAANGKKRPAGKEEIHDYFMYMSSQHMNARTFSTIKEYHAYLEESFQIVPSEWRKIVVINGSEGGVEDFFDACHTTGQLVDQLLIPTVEEALAGSGTTGFAETFEKKREHFKQSKQLRMQITESQLVEGQIQHYSQVFAEYHQASQEYEREKELAKALFTLANNEADQTKQDLTHTLLQKEQTIDAIRKIERQKMSREIALDQQELVYLQSQYQEESGYLDEKNTALLDSEHQQYTLEYAKHLKRKREAEENKRYAQERLSQLDEDEDISQLREDLERNTREIKGYYEDAERKLKREGTILQSQLTDQKSRLKQLRETTDSLQEKKRVAQQEEATWNAIIKTAHEQMTRIANKILSNPLQETVEDMHPKWKQQMEESLQNQHQYRSYLAECSEKKIDKQRELAEQQEKLTDEKDKLQEWKNRCEQVETLQKKVLIELKEAYPKWGYLDSLYSKQSSIIETLLENVAALEKEKEQLLL